MAPSYTGSKKRRHRPPPLPLSRGILACFYIVYGIVIAVALMPPSLAGLSFDQSAVLAVPIVMIFMGRGILRHSEMASQLALAVGMLMLVMGVLCAVASVTVPGLLDLQAIFKTMYLDALIAFVQPQWPALLESVVVALAGYLQLLFLNPGAATRGSIAV